MAAARSGRRHAFLFTTLPLLGSPNLAQWRESMPQIHVAVCNCTQTGDRFWATVEGMKLRALLAATLASVATLGIAIVPAQATPVTYNIETYTMDIDAA